MRAGFRFFRIQSGERKSIRYDVFRIAGKQSVPEASAGDFKVYDVATGTSTTICEMENVIEADFDHGIYITVDDSDNYSVVRVDDGSKLIDFNASDASVGTITFGEDLLIKYTVTNVDGAVETEESRYILINIDTTTPELF